MKKKKSTTKKKNEASKQLSSLQYMTIVYSVRIELIYRGPRTLTIIQRIRIEYANKGSELYIIADQSSLSYLMFTPVFYFFFKQLYDFKWPMIIIICKRFLLQVTIKTKNTYTII